MDVKYVLHLNCTQTILKLLFVSDPACCAGLQELTESFTKPERKESKGSDLENPETRQWIRLG
jgi:hypothetical protein